MPNGERVIVDNSRDHLRQIFVTLNMHTFNQPEVMVSLAQDKFDNNGKLIDSKVRQKIGELLTALLVLID